MKKVTSIISAALWLVGMLLLVVGLLTLPEDMTVAGRRLEGFAMWLDRETLIILLFLMSSIGFAWIAAEPHIQRWWEHQRRPLSLIFPNELNDPNTYGSHKTICLYIGPDRASIRAVKYFISVRNNTHKTVNNVMVVVHEIIEQFGDIEQSLKHFSSADHQIATPGFDNYVLLGERIDKALEAPYYVRISSLEYQILEKELEWESNFNIHLKSGGVIRLKGPFDWHIVIGLYADDVPPQRHLFVIRARNSFEVRHLGVIRTDEDIPRHLRSDIPAKTLP